VRIFRLPTDELESLFYVNGPPVISSLSFGPDSHTLAVVLGTVHAGCALEWHDLRRGARLESLHPNGEHGVWQPDPVLSADHHILAYQADEVFSSVLVRDRSPRRRGERLLCEPDGGRMYRELSAVALSPDGRLLAGASYSGESDGSVIHLWDLAAALERPQREDPWADPITPLYEPPLSTEGKVLCLAFAPGGGWLAAGLADGDVARWGLPSGWPSPPLDARGDGEPAVRRLAFSPDGRTLAAASGRTVTLFNPDTGAARALLTDHEHDVRDLAFHPGGRLLATVCGRPNEKWYEAVEAVEAEGPGIRLALEKFPTGEGTLRLWDADSGGLREQLDWGVGALSAVAFAPDGCIGAAGGEVGQIVLWDIDEG
jgi:WD40 repeat protein